MSFIRQAVRVALPRRALVIPRQNQFIFRGYSAAGGLSKEAIQTRVLDVLKGFEKVDQSKVCFDQSSRALNLLTHVYCVS